jgi:hypothetical protein
MAIVFPKRSHEHVFQTVLDSYGHPRGPTVDRIVKSMIRFFANSFLVMKCISGFGETNINRLLVNYRPDASKLVDDALAYRVVKPFKNRYWSDAQLVHWNLFDRLMVIHRNGEDAFQLRVVSFADVTLMVIFMVSVEMIQLEPVCFESVLHGDPFYVRSIICRHWFLNGLNYRDVFEIKFRPEDQFELRKTDYLRRCSKRFLLR